MFSSLGFYPVTPGVDQYVIGSPLFKKAVLHLENGSIFTIKAPDNSKENYYIQSVLLNGKTYDKTYLNFETIQRGGKIIFKMSDKPNPEWGRNQKAFPFSVSTDKKMKYDLSGR